MAYYNIEVSEDTKVKISKGNKKLGNIPQFNTLPGNEPILGKDGQPITNVTGSCGSLCEGCKHNCYAMRISQYHHNVIFNSWGSNTLMLREYPNKVKDAIIAYVQKKQSKYMRFHTSGEFESADHIALYADICRAIPQTTFYVYTKAFEFLMEYLSKGNTIPNNFVINLSEWHGNLDEFYRTHDMTPAVRSIFEKFNIFSYDDGDASCLAQKTKLTHCPAINEKGKSTGKHCNECRRCMTHFKVTAVYNH